jgi:ParB family transcriptional regulator, chromosome partitioning protein
MSMASITFDNAVRTDAYQLYPEDVVVVTDPEHPLFEPRALWEPDESMVLDIMSNGVEEAIIVMKDGGRPVVVNGRRRVICAREANRRLAAAGKELIRVKAVKRNGSMDELFGVSISTNEHRRNDSVTAKAEKCHKFLNMGRTVQEAAVRFGVSTETIKNWEKLVGLSGAVRKAVDEGSVSTTAAIQLAVLGSAEQEAALGELLAADKPTVTAAKKAAQGQAAEPTRRMRSKKEIEDRREQVRREWITNRHDAANAACLNLLNWVLNIDEDE